MGKCLKILGIVFGFIGSIAAIVTCVLPIWRVTTYIGFNVMTEPVFCEGLWMTCLIQSTGQMQCKVHGSLLDLHQDLQPARTMTVISIILGILGVLISIIGSMCMKWGAAKAIVMIISGIFFILAGILVLIPVCCIARNIIQDSYNPFPIDVKGREMGASLYIGWTSAALFLIGGVMLCSHCSSDKRYKPPRMVYTKADGEHNNINTV